MTSADSPSWVVDASVAFGWFAEVPTSARAVALLEADPPCALIAPDLVLVELLNAGWKALRLGAITDAQFAAIAEQRSAVWLTQDQRLLRKVESVPEAAGLVRPLEPPPLSGSGLA